MTEKAIGAAHDAAKAAARSIGLNVDTITDGEITGSEIAVIIRAAIAAYEKAMWRPIEEAPKDGTLYLLEVEIGEAVENPLDEEDRFVTIGGNNFDNDLIDEWKCAGWNWTHDCFSECRDIRPVRFRPLPKPEEM